MKLFAFLFLAVAACSAAPAHAQTAVPEIRVCTGGESGKYFQTAREIGSELVGALKVNVLPTNGSLDNLRQLDAGTCDAAIVQSDAYGIYTGLNPVSKLNIERVAPLYNEYAQLVCNKDARINHVSDLLKDDRGVMVGPQGSGTRVTWDTWVKQNPDYAKVRVSRDAGTRAITKAVDGTEDQCFLFISGLGAGSMVQANELAAGALTLVSVDDGSFDDVVDPKGKRVYEFSKIPSGTYPDLQNSGWFGSNQDIQSLAIGAVLVVNTAWVDANPRAYDDFATEALRWVKARQ